MWMAGYAGRTKPSEGVELDLFAKALVVEDTSGGKRPAVITMDLIGVPRNVRLHVAEQVQSKLRHRPRASRHQCQPHPQRPRVANKQSERHR